VTADVAADEPTVEGEEGVVGVVDVAVGGDVVEDVGARVGDTLPVF